MDTEIGGLTMEEIKNPVKAIRAFCVECCGGSANEVKTCTAPNCALFPFRLGKNPYRSKRELTDEQKAASAERLRLAREKQAAQREQSGSMT